MRFMKAGVLIMVACGLLVCSTAFVQAESKVIELRYANFFPPTHIQSKLAESWAAEVGKRTNGKVDIKYFPGGSLLKGSQMWRGVQKGMADIGMAFAAWNRGLFPALEAIDLPFGYPNAKVAIEVTNKFIEIFQPEELNSVKILYMQAQSPGILHTKRPVDKLEDVKGMKIRAGGTVGKVANYLGGIPVAMPAPGAYEALQKGVVDANLGTYEQLKGFKLAEVIDYTIENYSTAFSSACYIAMNKEKWDALPPDVKKVFDAVSAEWIAKHIQAWEESDKEGKEFTLEQGNEIIKQTPEESARWEEAVRPIFEDYITYANGKGLPGKEYVETIRRLIKEASAGD